MDKRCLVNALGILSENLLATAVKGECKSAQPSSRIIIFIPWHANRNLYGYDSQTYVRIASTNYLSHPNQFPASFPRRTVFGINFYGTETFLADFLD